MPESRAPAPWRWFLLAAVLVGLDQLTKFVVVRTLTFATPVEVLPFFSLYLTYNPGAAFSFLATASGWQRWFFVAVAVAASALISYLLLKHRRNAFLCLALALVLGGAVGNLIDRLLFGAVVDFVLLHWRQYHWPAFNLADSCITVGAGLLIWDSFRKPRVETAEGS
jgi:signal peptidase II